MTTWSYYNLGQDRKCYHFSGKQAGCPQHREKNLNGTLTLDEEFQFTSVQLKQSCDCPCFLCLGALSVLYYGAAFLPHGAEAEDAVKFVLQPRLALV